MIKISISIATITLILLLLASCRTRQDLPVLSQETPLIRLSKSTCRGKCKAYKLVLYENKTLHYEGIRNVERLGTYHSNVNEVQFQHVLESIDTEKFESLKSEYLTGHKDLQIIDITIRNTSIKFHKRRAPEVLIDIINELDELIDELQWTNKEQ